MKKKIGKKEKVNKKSDQRKRDQYTVVLEDINSKMDLLAEGQQSLVKGQQSLVEGHQSLVEGYQSLVEGQQKLNNKIDSLEKRFDKFEKETKDNFKAVFGYLSRIEDEIVEMKVEIKDLKEKKVEKVRLAELEKRVVKLERKVERRMAMAKV